MNKIDFAFSQKFQMIRAFAFDIQSGFFFSLLLLMFFLSGVAALIYEVVWFGLLELIIGSSAFSLAILLAVYMGGLFLGSLLFPSLFSFSFNPLRLYAFFEAGIGLMGLLIPCFLPEIMKIYLTSIGYGLPLFLLRGMIAAGLLFWPTMLMGGTLPIISYLFQPSSRGFSLIGWLYGINTAGGLFGTLAAAFYLLRLYDLMVANYVAVGLNFFLFLLGLGLSFLPIPELKPKSKKEKETKKRQPLCQPNEKSFTERSLPLKLIYFSLGLSGMSALGAEVVWTRLLSLSIGGTVYTFSLLLAAYLTGLAIGSAFSSKVIRHGNISPELLFGSTQLALIPAIIWAVSAITKIIPSLLPRESAGPVLVFFQDFLLCSLSLWPASFLWGTSYPLALASAGRKGQKMGPLVGRIYAANTAGSIAGALLFGLIFMPRLGSSGCHKLFIGFHALTSFGIFYFWSKSWLKENLRLIIGLKKISKKFKIMRLKKFPVLADGNVFSYRQFPNKGTMALLSIISLLLVYFILSFLSLKILPKTPWQLIAYGRKAAEKKEIGKPLMIEEGINSSVAVTSWNGITVFHTGGRAEASTAALDLRMERMLAHLPALLHPQPRKILVIGCGAGITAGTFLLYPGVERVVICEIEPAVWHKVVPFFRQENYNLDQDSRVDLIIEDARHFLLTSKEKFDLISSDPVHPWLKGSALLYTQEYFEMIKEKLNPGGLFTQWVPLYESDEATVKSMLATFNQVFPDGLIWSNDFMGIDYDFVIMGQKDKLVINIDDLQEKVKREAYRQVTQSMREVYFRSPLELLATYAGRISHLSSWLQGAQINRDRNLRLQYLAGWGLYLPYRISLLELLWTNFQFPRDLFIGSEENLQILEKMWRPLTPTKGEKNQALISY
ncbi:MAG: fused MFS/spermidine synthase [Candidatus Aminicenantes bacterium]|nr:fused MFS/spermidine synthase [Candidatus Aminicenantes bacterium]